MTTRKPKADPAAWKLAIAELREAKDAFRKISSSAPSGEFDDALDRYCAAENLVLDQGAPDLEGVISKLMIVFQDELHSELPESLQKLRVIGDLRRLTNKYE